jgi:sulfur relay (sulfurtransferase) DsrC/TusE family protein
MPVVENYLNGRIVKNDEQIYAKAWNAWASAWNQTLAVDERRKMSAPRYADLKEMN